MRLFVRGALSLPSSLCMPASLRGSTLLTTTAFVRENVLECGFYGDLALIKLVIFKGGFFVCENRSIEIILDRDWEVGPG